MISYYRSTYIFTIYYIKEKIIMVGLMVNTNTIVFEGINADPDKFRRFEDKGSTLFRYAEPHQRL